jgi:hypothetical protein
MHQLWHQQSRDQFQRGGEGAALRLRLCAGLAYAPEKNSDVTQQNKRLIIQLTHAYLPLFLDGSATIGRADELQQAGCCRARPHALGGPRDACAGQRKRTLPT